MKKIFIISYLFFALGLIGMNCYAQQPELNAKITINSDNISGIDKSVFTGLQENLMRLLNERRWTSATFAQNEKIECNFNFRLSQGKADNLYTAELEITSRRPVYNSSYITPTFVFKDTDIEFEYVQGDIIEYVENNITNNLVAIFTYYAYIILGIDFDSFALNGGKPYFEQAMNIANSAQSLNTKGWAAFDSDRNRYALALGLTEESSSRFHDMWYNYHRLGLDEMATSVVRGREKIKTAVKDLETIHSSRPFSVLILLFGDTKLNELIEIYSEVSLEEKKEAYDVLKKMYPSKNDLEKLRR